MSSPRLRAIYRFAGMLFCLCSALIAPSVSAFPIYTSQAETRTDFSSQAAAVGANSAALNDVGPDFPVRQRGVADSPLADSSPRTLAALQQTGTSTSARIEDYVWTLVAAPVATASVPDAELESLTIGGTQYRTGLDFNANKCSAKPGIAPCAAIEDAFFDLALAWSPEPGREEWYETVLSRI
jgi:hypothetical protein